jgi:hypothetical protein|nr:MAG TPA: hypothetical protein [Caudoviricetes sp.]
MKYVFLLLDLGRQYCHIQYDEIIKEVIVMNVIGILFVVGVLLYYIIKDPNYIEVFFTKGINGIEEYNKQKREDKIAEEAAKKRKELIAKGYSETEARMIALDYKEYLRRNGLGARKNFKY